MPSKFEAFRDATLDRIYRSLGMPATLRASGETLPSDVLSEADVPDQLWIEADCQVELIEAAAGDGDEAPKLKKFKLVAYTGGPMRPSGFGVDVVLDLSTTKVAAGPRPIFLQHDPLKPLGHAEAGQIAIAANKITAEGVFSAVNEHVDQVSASSANGFPWRASIGAPFKKIQYVDEGEKTQVNGKTHKGPLYVVSEATLMEISFVTLAGDDRTSARVTAQGGQSKEGSTMKFSEWLKAAGFKITELTAGQLKPLRAAWNAEHADGEDDAEAAIKAAGTPTPPTPPPANPPASGAGGSLQASHEEELQQLRAARAADLEREGKIAALIAKANLKPEDRLTIQASAVRDAWSTDRVELEIMRKERPSGGEFSIHAGAGGQNTPTPGVLIAALCQSFGNVPEAVIARGVSSEEMDKASSIRHRYTSLHALMDLTIQAAGGHFSGNRKSNDFIRAALRADRQLMGDGYSSLNASSGFTSFSLAGILGNVANKLLIAAFEAQEVVHPMLVKLSNHNDFKVHTTYRLDSKGGYKKVGKDGELKQSSMTETSFTNKLDTHGTIMAITRQDFYNDDLGAFEAIPTMLGTMSPQKREEVFFKLVLAAATFSSELGNILHGTDYVLGLAGLEKAREKFRNRVNPNGKPILVGADRMLVPTTLETTANNLYASEKVEVTTTANKPMVARNDHQGLYKPHISPYCNNTDITDVDGKPLTGQSATAWYLFSNPNVLAAFVMATLNGQMLPHIESDETDFQTLGMQWRAYDDFGFGQEAPEGCVKVTGVADPG